MSRYQSCESLPERVGIERRQRTTRLPFLLVETAYFANASQRQMFDGEPLQHLPHSPISVQHVRRSQVGELGCHELAPAGVEKRGLERCWRLLEGEQRMDPKLSVTDECFTELLLILP